MIFSIWIIRIVICGNQFEIDRSNPFKHLKSLAMLHMSRVLTDWGLVHVGIQFGPYNIDWLGHSHLRTDKLETKNTLISLYPNTIHKCTIELTEENKLKICKFINSFRTKKYNQNNHNCHLFVNGFLDTFEIKKNWLKKGPIRKFIGQIKNNECKLTSFKLDILGRKGDITDHNSLKLFWESLQGPLYQQSNDGDNFKTELDGDLSPMSILTERYEIVQLIKGLERGFIMRRKYVEPKIKFDEAQDKLKIRVDGITAALYEVAEFNKKLEMLNENEEIDDVISDDENNNNNL